VVKARSTFEAHVCDSDDLSSLWVLHFDPAAVKLKKTFMTFPLLQRQVHSIEPKYHAETFAEYFVAAWSNKALFSWTSRRKGCSGAVLVMVL
jgi:hypothetical protein